MRARFVACVALMAAGLAACGGSGATAPPPNNNNNNPGGGNPATSSVTVGNNSYTPSSVSVGRGGTVTWQWDACANDGYGGQQCVLHSVTFDDGGPSASLRGEGSFQRAFAAAGSYTYYCTAHGRAAMSGSVTVQ
jgi:plastocyanin